MFIVLFFSTLLGFTNFQDPFLVNGLQQGPYHVGFSSNWKLDQDRRYHLELDSVQIVSDQVRPLLMNMWYPTESAENKKMGYSEYLNIRSDAPQFNAFSQALAEYNRNVIANEVFESDYKVLSADKMEQFNELMSKKTAVIRNAAISTKQKWPLVIYVSGAGSSFEDNSVLCEYLASYGFVVLGSAYQSEEFRSLNIDRGEGTFADIEFMVADIEKSGNVDTKQLILIGHSLGAQTILAYQATGRSKAETIVLLDATFESHSLRFNDFWPGLPKLAAQKKKFNNRLFGISIWESIFQLYDLYTEADRYYLTIDRLGHNEFISQGVFKLQFEGNDTAVRSKYAFVCKTIKNVLTNNENMIQISDNSNSYFEHLAAGEENLQPDDDKLFTPRQHRLYAQRSGIAAALSVLSDYKQQQVETPLLYGQYGFAWVYDLLEENHATEAKQVFHFYESIKEKKSSIRSVFDRFIRLGTILGENQLLENLNSKLSALKD